MHILFVTHYFEPDSGAAAVRLSRLARQLRARGHRVTVLTTLPHYPLGKIGEAYRRRWSVTETRDDITVIRAWLWATPSPRISRKLISQLTFMVSAVLRGIALPRPDVVLIEAQPIFTGIAGWWISLIKRAPYVLNVSDLWPDHLLTVGALTERHLAYRAARAMVDGLYRGAVKIIAMSYGWKRVIEKHIGESAPVEVIYNGVDLSKFRPDIDGEAFRQKYNLRGQRIISFIGTFSTQYNFAIMRKVADAFREVPDILFVWIGGGSQSDYVRQLLSDEPENIHWIDWISHDEIPQAWASSYLCYWALRSEPHYQGVIPAKLYEAFACGVPVIAMQEGETAAIVEQSGAGRVIPFGDENALIEAIREIVADERLRNQYSANARAYAEAHFDPTRVVEAYEMALERAVSQGSDHEQVGEQL